MQKFSLDALGREHLERAHASSAGRSPETVHGGHEVTLRQTLIALTAGTGLGEHENPGEATVLVLSGRVRLGTDDGDSWEGRRGDLIVVPPAPLTVAVTTMVALAPLATLASVSVIVLPLLLSAKVAAPAVCVWLTRVVPAGNRSLSVTAVPASGPPLLTVKV